MILESAKADLRGTWDFYERKAVGLGDYFFDCVQSDVQLLSSYAGIHEQIAGYHRMLMKRFPFAIYYDVERQARAAIYAILDCRRDPDWIVKRLKAAGDSVKRTL